MMFKWGTSHEKSSAPTATTSAGAKTGGTQQGGSGIFGGVHAAIVSTCRSIGGKRAQILCDAVVRGGGTAIIAVPTPPITPTAISSVTHVVTDTLTAKGVPTVSGATVCVHPDWVTHSVEQRKRLPTHGYVIAAPSTAAEQHQTKLVPSPAQPVREPSPGGTSALGGPMAGSMAEGFIPVFFGSTPSLQDIPTAAEAAPARSAHTDAKRQRSEVDLEPSDKPRRVADATNVRSKPATAESYAWQPPACLARSQECVDAPEPEPFLSDAQKRQAAYIDKRKPFLCQKPAVNPHRIPLGATPSGAEPPAQGQLSFVPSSEPREVSEGASSSSARGVNDELLEKLKGLQEIYAGSADHWRNYAYRKAIGLISRYPEKIETAAQVRSIRGIGERIANKITEILETGTSTKLEFLQNSTSVKATQELIKIWGVGPKGAQLLKQKGYNTVAELRQCSEAQLSQLLTHQQLVGLRHYEDLQARIPREEVALIEQVFRTGTRRYLEGTGRGAAERGGGASWMKTWEITTCGSYRRGRPTCGDVDILVCDRSGKHHDGMLEAILSGLRSEPCIRGPYNTSKDTSNTEPNAFLLDDLTVSTNSRSTGECDTFMGVCHVPLTHCGLASGTTCPCAHKPDGTHYARRLDVKVYPERQYPFAVLYFTGSDYFNRSMRLYCQKKGLSLSDKDVRRVVRVRKEKVHEGQALEGCKTEEDIFRVLDLEYKTPQQRDA